jgi:hypothetical protein
MPLAHGPYTHFPRCARPSLAQAQPHPAVPAEAQAAGQQPLPQAQPPAPAAEPGVQPQGAVEVPRPEPGSGGPRPCPRLRLPPALQERLRVLAMEADEAAADGVDDAPRLEGAAAAAGGGGTQGPGQEAGAPPGEAAARSALADCMGRLVRDVSDEQCRSIAEDVPPARAALLHVVLRRAQQRRQQAAEEAIRSGPQQPQGGPQGGGTAPDGGEGRAASLRLQMLVLDAMCGGTLAGPEGAVE